MLQQPSLSPDIFKINLPFGKSNGKPFPFQGWVEKSLELTLGLRKLSSVYRSVDHIDPTDEFIDEVLNRLGVKIELDETTLDRIPLNGAVIVTANHPFGGIEGLIMEKLLKSVRPDVKIMANDILQRIPQLRELFHFVDPFGADSSKKKNIKGLREVIQWLKEGKVMGAFPSGEVSAYKFKERGILEPDWNENIAKIARRTNSVVVPMYFEGTNSLGFHLAGLAHPRLRTALLAHQFLNKKGHTIKVKIGNPKKPKEYENIDDNAAIRLMEIRTKLLGDEHNHKIVSRKQKLTHKQEVAEAVDVRKIEAEIEELRTSNAFLLKSGTYEVFITDYASISWIMCEIGRLRELSFRQVGEGCGKDYDLDSYDYFYKHLFIWDNDGKAIVGSYRIGHIDQIIKVFGKSGLYTNTLFKLKNEGLNHFREGLELGRSFVNPDYQRSFQPLFLLWKGICAYISKHPQYRYLLGAVSISDDYSNLTKQLMLDYLKRHHFHELLSSYVTPRHTFRRKQIAIRHKLQDVIGSLDMNHLNALVKEMEPKMGGVPILVKQYLKLNGKILGFNVDASFSNVVDGLIMVDLLDTDENQITRYFGKGEYQAYKRFHLAKNLTKSA